MTGLYSCSEKAKGNIGCCLVLNKNKQLGNGTVKTQADTQQTTIVNVSRLSILMKYALCRIILVLHCGVYRLICFTYILKCQFGLLKHHQLNQTFIHYIHVGVTKYKTITYQPLFINVDPFCGLTLVLLTVSVPSNLINLVKKLIL